MCGVDVEADKKNRRSLSSSDVCRTILTDIHLSCSQGTGRSQLDVQKFQEGYMCKSCFREIERLSVHEKQARELKVATNTSLPNLARQTLCLNSVIQVMLQFLQSRRLAPSSRLLPCLQLVERSVNYRLDLANYLPGPYLRTRVAREHY